MHLRIETDTLMMDLAALLGRMKLNLEDGGYIFDRPQDAFRPPVPNTQAVIIRMKEHLGSFPYTIESLYNYLGSVDFCGSTTAFTETEYPDPLQLSPFDYYSECYTRYVSSSEEKEWWDESYGSFALMISADHYHKEDVSGGPEHHICIPTTTDDPIVENAPWPKNFLDYLSSYLLFAGFSGYQSDNVELPPYYSDFSILLQAKDMSLRLSDLARKYRVNNC